ncbi:MAG: hypothetical protein ACE5NN_01455, partial [Candidatus Bathyarchaeia archaeon]
MAVASIGLSVVFSLSMIPEALQGEVIDLSVFPPPVEVGVLVDPLSVLMACIVSIIGLFVTVFSAGYMHEDPSRTRFWFIMQLFIAGYVLVVMADNFIFMFIGWEIVGVCVTYLTAYKYRKRRKAHLGLKVNMVADLAVRDMVNFVTGANEANYHYINVNLDRDFKVDGYGDIRLAKPAVACPQCGSPLGLDRGIEVGHCFYLGTQYSRSLGAPVLDHQGKERDIL